MPPPVKILVIEDNALNRWLLRDILSAKGYEVLEAEEAATGLALARSELPALILMDVALPEMDGLTATRLLKGDPVTAAIPVCAVTAHAMAGDEEMARAAGCDAYLTKPVDIQRLRTLVDDLVSRDPTTDRSVTA